MGRLLREKPRHLRSQFRAENGSTGLWALDFESRVGFAVAVGTVHAADEVHGLGVHAARFFIVVSVVDGRMHNLGDDE